MFEQLGEERSGREARAPRGNPQPRQVLEAKSGKSRMRHDMEVKRKEAAHRAKLVVFFVKRRLASPGSGEAGRNGQSIGAAPLLQVGDDRIAAWLPAIGVDTVHMFTQHVGNCRCTDVPCPRTRSSQKPGSQKL